MSVHKTNQLKYRAYQNDPKKFVEEFPFVI